MAHLVARGFLFIASPILMVVYWRNNLKKMNLEELRLMLSYNDLGSYYSEG